MGNNNQTPFQQWLSSFYESQRSIYPTQRQFAEWVGIDHAQLSRLLSGERQPGAVILSRLAQKAGVSMADLLTIAGMDSQDVRKAEVDLLARRILNLPQDKQQIIGDILTALTARSVQEVNDAAEEG